VGFAAFRIFRRRYQRQGTGWTLRSDPRDTELGAASLMNRFMVALWTTQG
jgi:hypothetical protein